MAKKAKIQELKARFATKRRDLETATAARDTAYEAVDREEAEHRRREILEELDVLEDEAAALGCGDDAIVLRRAISFLTRNVRETNRAPSAVLTMCRELIAA